MKLASLIGAKRFCIVIKYDKYYSLNRDKFMKNRCKVVLYFVFVSILFLSCTKDKEETPDYLGLIVGLWDVTKLDGDECH